MMRRSIFAAIAFSAALFILPGCSSFETALISALDELTGSGVEYIDHSYPVIGAAAQEGAIVFKSKPGFWEKLFKNPASPVPADENEIVVYFVGFEIDFR
jgi:hypothetical protein